MANITQTINHFFEKHQGSAARTLDQLPSFVQKGIVKALGYPYQYPVLDSFTQCLMAVQLKQGQIGLFDGDIDQSRQSFDLQMKALRSKPTNIKRVADIHLPLQNGTITARHYHPDPNQQLPMIVFYHGGGFILGNLDTHDEACRLIATHTNAQVLSVDYPLAPEASPQVLIQSCEDALVWVYQNKARFKILKNRIAVAGDSAGGNISTVIAQRSANKCYAPQMQFLIYPVVDFKSRHPSFYAYKEGLVLTGRDIQIVTQCYATQHQVGLDDPLISPIYGNLDNIAPAYIAIAGHDVLHDEGEIYYRKLCEQGVVAYLDEYLDQTHGFINLTCISHTAKRHLIHMSQSFRQFWDENLPI